jgi:hypothetical protein
MATVGRMDRSLEYRGDDVLESDHAARAGNRGGDQRGHVVYPQRGAGGCPARAQRGSTCPGSPAPRQPDQLGQGGQRSHRYQPGQPPLDQGDLTSVAPAGRAVAKVPPSDRPGAHALLMSQAKCLPDLRAGGVASRVGPYEAHSGPDQKRLHGRNARIQNGGHLGVGDAAEFPQQQRRALLLGEPADVLNQAAQGLTGVGASRRVIGL